MSRIVVYPNFAGVDVTDENGFTSPVKEISLSDLLINEKYKDKKHFSSVEKKQQLEKMAKKIDKLPPILVIKHPILKDKYSILDGHHRFQLFKTLKKDTIPAQVIDDKNIFLAKNEYGAKNNKAIRLDKIGGNDINLEKYFNTDVLKEELEEKWTQKYKRSIDCNNPKGFSQKAHCAGKKKRNMNEKQILKGGLADNVKLIDIAKKHKVPVEKLTAELEKGVKVEMEHTKNKAKAKEIAMDHLFEDPKYYTKLKKIETKEAMGADAAGAFDGPAFVNKGVIKRPLNKIHNFNESEEEVVEATDASSSGSYDVPLFGGTKGRKNPLAIGGPETIKKSRAVKDKNFPKWGGPGGVFIKIKEKCKKYPYCNQGDINALELLESLEINENIRLVAKKYGLPEEELQKIVINEISKIFIGYEK